jgi:hypothetical protein
MIFRGLKLIQFFLNLLRKFLTVVICEAEHVQKQLREKEMKHIIYGFTIGTGSFSGIKRLRRGVNYPTPI